MTFGRRKLLRGGVGVAAAAGLGGAAHWASSAPPAHAGERKIRVGYLPITDSAPLLVAHSSGLLDRAGLDVDKPVLFRGWAGLAEAFLAREVDIVHLLMPFAVQLRFGLGTNVRVIAWNHTNGSAVTTAPGMRATEDLAGQKVAIPYWWSVHNIAFQDMLRNAGLKAVVRRTPSHVDGEVELVVMTPPDMLPALDAGTIGGYTVADPFNAAAEVKHVGRIHRFLGDVWRDHACCVVVAHQDLIDTRPADVQATVDALAEAQLRIRGDRPGAARQLTRGYLPQPLNAINRSLTYPASSSSHHPDWHGERIDFQPFPFPSFTERLITSMRHTVVDGDTRFLDTIAADRAHDDFVDDRFARNAIAKLGGPTAFGLATTLSRTEDVSSA
jgi:NitT/TauT family transport system substrate-binding protein